MNQDIIILFHKFGAVIGERVRENFSGSVVTLKKPFLLKEDGQLVSIYALLEQDELSFAYDDCLISHADALTPCESLRQRYIEAAGLVSGNTEAAD